MITKECKQKFDLNIICDFYIAIFDADHRQKNGFTLFFLQIICLVLESQVGFRVREYGAYLRRFQILKWRKR